MANLSQIDLAVAISASRQTVMSLEQGDSFPHLMTAFRLATALNCKVEDLYIRGDETGPNGLGEKMDLPAGS